MRDKRDKIHQFTVSVRMVVVCRLVGGYSHGTGLKGVEETALLQIEPVYFRTVRAGQKKSIPKCTVHHRTTGNSYQYSKNVTNVADTCLAPTKYRSQEG